MQPVPADPDAFFTSYLPSRYAEASGRVAVTKSVGSATARVLDAGEWSLRIEDGVLRVSRGMEDDVMLQLTVTLADFDVLVRESLSAGDAASAPLGRIGPLRALAADPETARLVRHVPGSVLLVARDGPARHRLLMTPGRRKADLASADCTIDCSLDDLRAAQAGAVPPMQLFVSGKLRITGNVQIAMALAGIFA
ncbi:MAG TPA: SCP2 sterol-binding domain-containing protein [Polyangiaceae bacterium]|nr:SCP2 sterol-binding domain-containing protein [Polyangiaceae bacterium]